MTQPDKKSKESKSLAIPVSFVFDACAVIAYFNDEPGADKAERLIERAKSGEVHLYMASINVYEVYYDAMRHSSSEMAEELLSDIYRLPFTIVESIDRAIMRHAGHFKTTYKMSLADSLALGLAKRVSAKFVSTDHHELDTIEESGELEFSWLR